MKSEGKRKYGLVTLVSAVIGTVIGSGIFFKTEEILNITNGNVLLGFFILLAGGGITLVCASAFALLSVECGSESGVVGYAEKTCGRGLARFAAIFSADFYLPSMTAALAFVSGGYFCALLGVGDSSSLRIAVSGAFLVIFFAANTLSPELAARFQVVTTVLKLLPILAVGAVGCVALFAGGGANISLPSETGGVASALLSSAFAYEGWIAVTALGDDVKNARRNMPLALTIGTGAVLVIYLFYYLGAVGASGDGNSVAAFERIFGGSGGRFMLIFVTISCLGALNGLTMSVTRGHYLLSRSLGRDDGRALFSEISDRTGIPVLSGVMGLFVSEIWLCFFAAREIWSQNGLLRIDPSEASISVMYAIYVPIFVMAAVRLKELSPMKRFVLPIFAALAATVVALSSPVAFGVSSAVFVLVVAIVSGAVLFVYRR